MTKVKTESGTVQVRGPMRPGFEAILFITHDLDLAICYANRVILMHEGQIAGDGPRKPGKPPEP